MKIESATNNPRVKPFVNDGKLSIEAHHEKGKITKFIVTCKKETLEVEVKKFNILAAWKEVEKFLKPL